MIDFDKLTPRTGRIIPSPLVPEDGLYLYDLGIFWNSAMYLTPSRITRKFTQAFQKAWGQIRAQDRNTLREFWPKKPIDAGRQPSPGILFNSPNLPKSDQAACRGGHELLFNAFVVDYSTPTSIVHFIAHELGHAISYPHGWYEQHECEAKRGDECVACECRAYSYMAAWGFDPFVDWLPKRKRLIDRFKRG